MIFRFKKFAINHGNSSMRVGTDAVILGAWAKTEESETILDIGTGCGIIALMMAQKSQNSQITAIDIHTESIVEARSNFENSDWSNQLFANQISLSELAKHLEIKFSLVICNPPFFIDSTPAPVKSRHNARHANTLLPEDFFKDASQILTEKGKIFIIIPALGSERWLNAATNFKLFPARITSVHAYSGKVKERLLLEFTFQNSNPVANEFYIREGKNLGYTESYKELTKDFYL